MRPPKLTEKRFMAQVVEYARLAGWLVYHTHDSRRSCAGFPDLLLVRGATILAAELKVGTKRPTAEQQAWLEALEAAGVPAYLWRPADWPEIERVLGSEIRRVPMDEMTEAIEALRHRFEQGEVPCDEPPGLAERAYQEWKRRGGKPCEHPGKKVLWTDPFGREWSECPDCGAKQIGGVLQ